ncbi:hypothetical protein [Rhizobium sp. Root1203]|uniref:hypothetical protein n=1 Tax=Rhizobium sp. Root1203 TaxID=1736427 RepID=UPI000A6E86B8|nr:hypothetical protein [Rhizobium sp. Root1203]
MAEAEIISPALGALLDIMLSSDIAEARCVEAAGAIIEYEAPVEVFDITRDYLVGVAEDKGQDVKLRLEVLKLLRKVEAKRVMPGTATAVDSVAAMALGRRLAIAKRRVELMRGGQWPAREGWQEEVDPVRGMVVEGEGAAVALEAARIRVGN